MMKSGADLVMMAGVGASGEKLAKDFSQKVTVLKV
jgi:hypothetical protein